MALPTEDELKQLYREWFTDNYGVPPVITSSTGMPAVTFALHVLQRYATCSGEAND
jgi:hypothetical protein